MKIFQRVITTLLSLFVIFNMACLTFAADTADTADITKVTAQVSLDISNEGIRTDSPVKVDAYVTFIPDSGITETKISMVDIKTTINFDKNVLGDVMFSSNDSPFAEPAPDDSQLDCGSFLYTWGDLTTKNTVNLNEKLYMGTLEFKLLSAQEDGTDLEFTVDVGVDGNGDPCSWFKTADDVSAKLTAQEATTFTHELLACQHNWIYNSKDNTDHTKACSKCGVNVTENHDFTTEEIAATEKTFGFTKYTCSKCNHVYYDNFRPNIPSATPSNVPSAILPDNTDIFTYFEKNNTLKKKQAKTEVELSVNEKMDVRIVDPHGALVQNEGDTLEMEINYINQGTPEHDKLMSLYDGGYDIENINLFNVSPVINGIKKEGQLAGAICMAYEIPEGWDAEAIDILLIKQGEDQEFEEEIIEIDGKKYVVVWKDHFSPYAMIQSKKNISSEDNDQNISDSTANGSNGVTENGSSSINTNKENSGITNQDNITSVDGETIQHVDSLSENNEQNKSNQISTGDQVTYFTISSLGLIMTLALGLMFKTTFGKRKFND